MEPNSRTILTKTRRIVIIPENDSEIRPPSVIRATCRNVFVSGIKATFQIAKGYKLPNGESPTNAQRLQAKNILRRFGFAENETILPNELVEAAGKVLGQCVPKDKLDSAIQSLVADLETNPEIETSLSYGDLST